MFDQFWVELQTHKKCRKPLLKRRDAAGFNETEVNGAFEPCQCRGERRRKLERSMSEGQLPACWKSSMIIPLFKKGSRLDPLNYRPISLTSVVCKTMARLVYNQPRSYLEVEPNSLPTSNQFSFRRGRSTMDQLLLAYNTASKNTDLGGVTDVILFDFSKAFDVVCHDVYG